MIKSIVYTSVLCFLTLTVVNIHEGNSEEKKNLLAISLSFSASAAKLARSVTCDDNEVFNECGSACPPSCSDLFYPQEIRFCTLQCVSGCFCRQGLVRAQNGRCVRPATCCTGANEVYLERGTGCPARCGYQPEKCDKDPIAGCFCRRGFIRKDDTTNSPCIRPTQC